MCPAATLFLAAQHSKERHMLSASLSVCLSVDHTLPTSVTHFPAMQYEPRFSSIVSKLLTIINRV